MSLSITQLTGNDEIERDLATLAGVAKAVGGRVVLGGAGVLRAVASAGGDCTVLDSSAEVVEYIGAFGSSPASSGMPQA